MNPSYYMQQAIRIAEQARYLAPPNPWVGCVIVKNGQIIGKGHTLVPGQAHAEICALQEAQAAAKGATMYVTLEPCSHFGRTPPCVNAIIQAGIAEVFIAQQDPDSRVQGKGIALLKQAGIKTHLGLCQREAADQLFSYLYHRTHGIPYTIVKSALSIDGRTAAEDGSSQWITSLEAREDAHLIRADSQAIIVGAGTAKKDLPQLTVRHKDIHLTQQPLRIILDAKGTVPPIGPLFDPLLAPTLIITAKNRPKEMVERWKEKGVEIASVSTSSAGYLDLHEIWQELGKRNILQVLVEGGSTLQTEVIKNKLMNQLTIYLGPLLLGSTGLPFFLEKVSSIQEASMLSLKSTKIIQNCIRLDYICS